MATKKKKIAEERPPDTSHNRSSLRKTVEKKLASSSSVHPDMKGQSAEELVHELLVHQTELETQAEELRNTQLALEESRDQYIDLYEFAPLGYLTLTDTARISQANLTVAVLLGVDRSKLINTRFRRWIVPEDLEIWERYFTNLLHSKKRLTATLILKRGDGTTFPARLESIRLTGSSNGQSIRMAISDISDIRKAEGSLRESEKKLRTIIDILPVGVSVLDAKGRITYENPALRKIVQMTPDGLQQEKFKRRTYVKSDGTIMHSAEFASKQATLEQKTIRNIQTGIELEDGKVIWTDVSAVPVALPDWKVVIITTDITDKKQVEDRLQLAQTAAGMGIWDWDVKAGTLMWDSHMFAIFGLDQEKDHASFDIWNHILHPEDLELANSRIEQALKDHTDLFSEYRIIHPSGEVRWISALGKGIYNDRGFPVRMSGICIDITGRRKVEQALRESENRFRLALKNAPVAVAIQNKDLVYQWAYNPLTLRPTTILGKKDTDLFIPEDAARLMKLKRKVLETGKEVQERIWLTIEGERLFLDLYIEPLQEDTGQITGIGVATVDLTEQKLIEDSLRHSEAKFRQSQELLDAVTKGTDVLIAVQDRNFNYIFFNQAYKEEIKRITGKDLTLGSSMIELFADIPEEQKRAMKEWSKVLHGENVNQRVEFGSPGTYRRVFHVLHTPIRDPQGNIVGAGEVAYDVTKQIQVEDALRETKEYLDNLITYANAPIIVWDPQFRITLFNQAFEHLTGRKANEVIGKNLDVLLPKNYQTVAMDLIRKTMEGVRWESVEIPILHKNGGVRTVLWNSAAIIGPDRRSIVSTIAQGQDITDRKKIEYEYKLRAAEYAKMNAALNEEIIQREISDTKLKKTLSLLNASLESTADGILVVDLQGKITSYNQNFVNMWNVPTVVLESGEHETIINNILPQLKNPESFLANIKELQSNPHRESFDMIEFNDGKIFERFSKPQVIGDMVAGRVWSFRDITDRKHAEEKLVASVAEKEVLLREIHHRVKNNLQLISGLLDMTRMNSQDESTNSILTDMMLKIQTMAQIHTRLYESKQFGKINLRAQIRDQIAGLSSIYSHKDVEISCEIHSQEVFLPVDQAIPCALVVNEILSNAYKHAFVGRKKGTIEISALQENNRIRITVRDNGIGLPDNFDISHTSSLGIQLIRTLVQHQLKGSLSFKSRKGTEIRVEFPTIITEA